MKFKKRYAYYAILTPENGEYGVLFPDLVGAYSQGVDEKDAIQQAKECLALHLHGMEEDGDPIPKPSRPENIEKKDDEILVKIDVNMQEFFPEVEYEERGGVRSGSGRPKNSGRQAGKRLVVRITDEEDELLSQLASKVGKTKSEYVRSLILANKETL